MFLTTLIPGIPDGKALMVRIGGEFQAFIQPEADGWLFAFTFVEPGDCFSAGGLTFPYGVAFVDLQGQTYSIVKMEDGSRVNLGSDLAKGLRITNPDKTWFEVLTHEGTLNDTQTLSLLSQICRAAWRSEYNQTRALPWWRRFLPW